MAPVFGADRSQTLHTRVAVLQTWCCLVSSLGGAIGAQNGDGSTDLDPVRKLAAKPPTETMMVPGVCIGLIGRWRSDKTPMALSVSMTTTVGVLSAVS